MAAEGGPLGGATGFGFSGSGGGVIGVCTTGAGAGSGGAVRVAQPVIQSKVALEKAAVQYVPTRCHKGRCDVSLRAALGVCVMLRIHPTGLLQAYCARILAWPLAIDAV